MGKRMCLELAGRQHIALLDPLRATGVASSTIWTFNREAKLVRKHALAVGELLSLCAFCLSLAVFAQQSPKVFRVGMLL